MMKYLLGLMLITLSFSCAALKKNSEEKAVVEVETVVEEEPVKSVPDHLPQDISPQGDCREDWSKKERKMVYMDKIRVKRMSDATSGVIWVTARVGKNGYVNFAKIDHLNTTVENKKILNMALEIVQEIQFEESQSAPTNDCGVVKFNFNNM